MRSVWAPQDNERLRRARSMADLADIADDFTRTRRRFCKTETGTKRSSFNASTARKAVEALRMRAKNAMIWNNTPR